MSKPTTSSSRRHPALCLLFPPSAPRITLSTLARYTSTPGGLDRALMALQYPARALVPVLLLVARWVSKSQGLPVHASRRISARLVGLTGRLNALATSVGDARTMMRLFGLLPILAALQRLSHSPDRAFSSPSSTLSTLQLLSLLIYYPLEHATYLASKGVVPLSPARQGRWALWSVRAWAAYVLLDLVGLWRRRGEMIARERVQGAGTDTVEEKGAQAERARGEWKQWTEELMVNVGYAPLTIHWSVPGGLWANPGWTGLFGTIAAFSGIRSQWRKMAV